MAREILRAMSAQPRMPKRTGRGGGGCTGAAEDDIGSRGAAAMAAASVGLGSVCGVIVCVSVCVVRGVQFSFRVQDNQDRLGSWLVGCRRWMCRLVLGLGCGEMQNSSSGLDPRKPIGGD
jgi:hypothetical protein